MDKCLLGRTVAIIGGDKRELVLMEELVRQGAQVLVVGYEQLSKLPAGLVHQELAGALTDADAVILPMPGINEQGVVKAEFAEQPLVLQSVHFSLIKPGTVVLVGIASQYLKSQALQYGLKLIETAELDEIAIYNSIPTAEGAIEIAMKNTSFTLHGSHVLICGFGRIGMTLARMLKGIGAWVHVLGRKAADLARGEEQGYQVYDYDTVFPILNKVQVVFNTVPHIVLTEKYLTHLQPGTLVIELASSPGGIDIQTAEKLGLNIIKAMGLPGKVAPHTAGRILGQTYPKLLMEQWDEAHPEEVAQ